MKLVIQRVTHAEVAVDEETIGAIGNGLMVLIGVGKEDTEETVEKYLKKLLGLRIFADEAGKTNLSIRDVKGELLLISQFTLYASCKKGNRPSFTEAGAPDEANRLYEYMIRRAREEGMTVATGSFGADMKVSLLNDGPFTIVLENL